MLAQTRRSCFVENLGERATEERHVLLWEAFVSLMFALSCGSGTGKQI